MNQDMNNPGKNLELMRISVEGFKFQIQLQENEKIQKTENYQKNITNVEMCLKNFQK